MSDAVRVTLTLHNSHSKHVEELISHSESYQFVDKTDILEDSTSLFTFDKVVFGSLPFLEDLIRIGIAFDTEWNVGINFSAGSLHCRFDANGKTHLKKISESMTHIRYDLLKTLSKNPEELLRFIDKKYEQLKVPDWNNQIEYGKIHAAMRLVT